MWVISARRPCSFAEMHSARPAAVNCSFRAMSGNSSQLVVGKLKAVLDASEQDLACARVWQVRLDERVMVSQGDAVPAKGQLDAAAARIRHYRQRLGAGIGDADAGADPASKGE